MLVANENKPLLSFSPFVDLVLTINLLTFLMGALEPSLPPVDPSEFSFQDIFLLSDEDILEAMTSLDIPLDDVSMVLSNDHILILTIKQLFLAPIFLLSLISPSVYPYTLFLMSLLTFSLSFKLVSLKSLMSHIYV